MVKLYILYISTVAVQCLIGILISDATELQFLLDTLCVGHAVVGDLSQLSSTIYRGRTTSSIVE